MNRKPSPALTNLLLALLLLAGGVVPLQAVGPASGNLPSKSKASNPKPAVETVAPVVKAKQPEASPQPESAAKPQVMPDDQAPEAVPKRKDRGGLISALKARKQEREKQKAEQEASATPENPAPATAAKPGEIEHAEPEKAGFFARVFKKRPGKQSVQDAPGKTGKPAMPEADSTTPRAKKDETQAPIPKVRPKRRGFDPPWSQKKDVPESAEAPTAETDASPGKKTQKRGFRLPWSQKKDAPESAEALPAETDATPEQKTKRRGFRWPWSQRKEAPVLEETPSPEREETSPPPSSVDPISLLDIKPREPEAALAPSAAPTPPGKKPNPLDDIGLHPER